MSICLDKALLGLGGSVLSEGIEQLSEQLKGTINTARQPAQAIPPFLTTIEGMTRPGLSAKALTANVISRLGEAGIDTSPLPDGSQPQINAVIRIVMEEIVKEIQLNMKGMTEIRPGTLVGMAGSIPVISTQPIQGTTINL